MTVRQYKSLQELQELLDKEISGDRRERPENNFVENALKITIANEFTATAMEVYGYPGADAQYIFFVEFSDKQYPYVHVRKPLTGHNIAMLDEAVPLFVDRIRSLIAKHGQILIVGDVETGDAFNRHLTTVIGESYTSQHNNECGVFYMTPTQREAVMEEKSEPPAGFSFDPVDVDRDGETIHRFWKNGIDVELTKNRLRYLPSICARTDEAEVVGWAMSARFGQVSNLYMMPEYRNRGAGKALEISVAKEFARREMRVFKYVEATNASVYRGSLRSPLWTQWMREDDDNNQTVATMCLREFKSSEELQALLDREIGGDKWDRPENNFLENTLKIAIAGEFTATYLEVFGFPETNCQYFIFLEHSDVQDPFIHVRKPLTGHEISLLNQAVSQLVELKRELFSKSDQLIIVGDVETGDSFDRHLGTASVPTDENGIFYMTSAQKEALLEIQLDEPSGFAFDKIDVDTDGDIIHRMWKNGLKLELTKDRLRFLPSICARTTEGKLVGWAMSARFGQVSNVYVLPDYRSRGIGQALELSVAQEFARRGMRVFKYVATDNTSVYEGSRRSPLWTLWMSENEDDNGEKKPELKYWRFCRFAKNVTE